MELNKTVYLDGYVYETTLLFCETLKFSKAADLKKNHQWNHLCGFYLTDNIY